MEDRFWFRHDSLRGPTGPHSKSELHSAIISSSLPSDGEVLPYTGQSAAELSRASSWQPVTDLIDIEQPNLAAPAPHAVSSNFQSELHRVRRDTAYDGFRQLVVLGTLVAIMLDLASMIITLSAMRQTIPEAILLALIGTVFNILVILVIAGALRLLADLGDCALRRNRDAG